MIDAATDALERGGRSALTVTAIIRNAGVSRKTFYEQFTDAEDCLLEVLEHAVVSLGEPVRRARESQPGWLDGLRAAVAALLAAIDANRPLARVALLDSLTGARRVLERRDRLIEQLALEITPPVSRAGGLGEPYVARATIGGISELLVSRLRLDDSATLADLYAPIMSLIVLPGEGRKAARAELERPVASPSGGQEVGELADRTPLHDLRMRLTYRTVMVIGAIAGAPGASNRQIAEVAGVIDAGQISKLLKRLARLGLIENRGGGQPNGVANSWYLTASGEAVQAATQGRRVLASRPPL
jgi:AcrR family transcriptional regulator/DNA-binding MarR family transcriptional regulator